MRRTGGEVGAGLAFGLVGRVVERGSLDESMLSRGRVRGAFVLGCVLDAVLESSCTSVGGVSEGGGNGSASGQRIKAQAVVRREVPARRFVRVREGRTSGDWRAGGCRACFSKVATVPDGAAHAARTGHRSFRFSSSRASNTAHQRSRLDVDSREDGNDRHFVSCGPRHPFCPEVVARPGADLGRRSGTKHVNVPEMHRALLQGLASVDRDICAAGIVVCLLRVASC